MMDLVALKRFVTEKLTFYYKNVKYTLLSGVPQNCLHYGMFHQKIYRTYQAIKLNDVFY